MLASRSLTTAPNDRSLGLKKLKHLVHVSNNDEKLKKKKNLQQSNKHLFHWLFASVFVLFVSDSVFTLLPQAC